MRRFFLEIGATHSHAVRRVSEVMRWVQSGEYDRIIRGEYRKRSDDTNVREEAGDAMEFYAARFRAFFQELGDNVTTIGSQVGDVSQQIAGWLRNRDEWRRRKTCAGLRASARGGRWDARRRRRALRAARASETARARGRGPTVPRLP